MDKGRSVTTLLLWRQMHVSNLLRSVPFQFLELLLPISAYEFVDAHETAADSHYKFVVQDFSENLLSTEHVVAFP